MEGITKARLHADFFSLLATATKRQHEKLGRRQRILLEPQLPAGHFFLSRFGSVLCFVAVAVVRLTSMHRHNLDRTLALALALAPTLKAY